MKTENQVKLETKVYTLNKGTEFYELLPQEREALSYLSKTKTEISEWHGLMPDEVNNVVTIATPLFWQIEVWEVHATPDPFLIGKLVQSVYFINEPPKSLKKKYKRFQDIAIEDAKKLVDDGLCTRKELSTVDNNHIYLLAQWGRELKKLSELINIAKNKFLTEEKRRWTEEKLEAEKRLSMLELDAEAKFGVIY